MTAGPQALLIGSVVLVGVLHTLVPDHWVPITLLARQRNWTRIQVAGTAFQAGIGHVSSTLIIAALVWAVGAEVAKHFAHIVDTVASISLVLFGLWTAAFAWQECGHVHPEQERQSDPSGDKKQRITLLMILGSSPMVEGIPAFFAASKYGVRLLAFMAIGFAVSTIATYVGLCVLSTIGLKKLRFGPLERYGELLSGLTIALVGVLFWIWSAK